MVTSESWLAFGKQQSSHKDVCGHFTTKTAHAAPQRKQHLARHVGKYLTAKQTCDCNLKQLKDPLLMHRCINSITQI